jgi:hypothetical protein
MENKRFNYIEFKIDIINNELTFLEDYLLTNVNKLDENSLTNIKEKLTNLINKLTQVEQNYSVVKEKKEDIKEEIVKVKEATDVKEAIDVKEAMAEVKDCSKPSIDILKYNEDIVYKVSQINYII